jgi:DNA-binding CsgD family transcriptional regulator
MAEPEPAIQGTEEDVRLALRGCNTPFFVFSVTDRTIWLTNPAGEELAGLPENQIVGRKVSDFLSGPGDAIASTLRVLESGVVDAARTRRTLRRGTGTLVPVYVWSRAVTVGGRRGAVGLVLPVSQVGLAGRDPAAPWRSLATVVVGVADRHWRVEAISKDIGDFPNFCVDDVVGRSVLDLLEPVGDAVTPREPPGRGHLRCPGRGVIDVSFLYSPLPGGEGRKVFAIVGEIDPRAAKDPSARVQELELRLQRIGAEVRAARIIDDVAGLPGFEEDGSMPDLGDLTTRQWAILSRLGRGERVPQIAKDLYLSQSTVRNHLSAIFQKFGVHTQGELLARLRSMREEPGEPGSAT